MAGAPDTFQVRFERKWAHLTRPHVRALAWLLDGPDLLDPGHALWEGKIATLGQIGPATAIWLAALEEDPAPLEAALGVRSHARLGLYAEALMAFYFEQQRCLVAHGLQVRANLHQTLGEFDFLLRSGATLWHWEFATKFYLLQDGPDDAIERLVGPGLTDTLGAKMRKIIGQQLLLGRHPAAQSLLPQALAGAQALVKGWLFYRDDVVPAMAGIGAAHNHGFWCPLEQAANLRGEHFVVLARRQWLAPVKAALGVEVLSRQELPGALAKCFATMAAPVMVAAVREENGWILEQERGFVVPDHWLVEAGARARAALPS